MMKTFIIILILGFQIATINVLQAQIVDLNLENILGQFPDLCGATQILQDRYGFMWFGSGDGLKKFDGYQVIVYQHDPADSTSLSDNLITALVEGKDQHLWIGTINGLNKLDMATGKFKRFKSDPQNPNSLSHNYITSLCFDGSGKLWIGTQLGGLNEMIILNHEGHDSLYFRHHQHDPDNSSSLSDNYIRFIHDDTLHNQHTIWIGTASGLNCFDQTTQKFVRYFHDPDNPNSLASDDLYSIYQDKLGDLWIGASDGWLSQASLLNQGGIRFRHYKLGTSIKIYDIVGDEFNNLWLSSFHYGLYRFNKTTHQIMHCNKDNLQFEDSMTASKAFIDRSGTLWIGTWPHLYKHDLNRKRFNFIPIDPPPTIWSMAITSLVMDKKDVPWLGTYGRGVMKYDLRSGAVSNFAPDSAQKRYLSSRFVQSILEDHSGTIWVATFHGLNRYDQKRDRFESFYWDPDKPDNPNNLISNYIYCLHEDRQGNLWIGSARGVSRLNHSRNQFTHYLNRADQIDMIGHYIGAIHQDRNGTLWIGAKGLFQFNPATDELIRYFDIANDSSANRRIDAMVFDIFEDTSGDIWVATQDGLYRLRHDQPMIHYTEKNGLPSRYIVALIEDDQKNLWICTQAKLARYDPKSNEFRTFDLIKQGFNTKSCFKGEDSKLYFGQANGFLFFDPKAIQDNPYPPLVWITNFRVFDQPISFDQPIYDLKEIRLSYRQNFFTLDFVALNYTETQKNQYAYQLERVDPDWVHCGDRRSASYTNIPPGKYIFKVKGSNNDGVWNEQGAWVRIIITPPWWRSHLAFFFYFIILVSLLLAFRQFELRRSRLQGELKIRRFESQKLQEIDSMKSRFFANISHEFRTPLTLILGPLGKMLSQAKNKEKKQELKMMQRNARRLQRLINQLLDLSKIEAGKMTLQARPENIVALLNRIVQSFESQSKLKGIELKFQSEQDEIIAYVDRDKIENIFYNLLSNALKFTPAGGLVEVAVAAEIVSGRVGEGERGRAIGSTPTLLLTPSPALSKPGRWVQITIKDNGIGIPPDRLDKIFNRFYQVDDSYTREHEGSGIGLALTKELVDLHHGKIEVQSELNKGTTFTVCLLQGKEHLKPEEIAAETPVEAIQLTEEPSEDWQPLDGIPQPSHRKALPLVLIVEDNHDMRTYMQDCLVNKYRVFEAIDGEDGLQTAIEKIPDLIISDVMMPKMDGFQLCQRLKSDERTSHIPVILLTARATAESKIKGLELGADDYLIKPFDRTELLVRSKNLIEQRRKLREKFSSNIFMQPSEIAVSSFDQRFLQRTLEIIEKHLADPNFDITALTGEIGMSRMQLHRKLHALTNQSANKFIRSIRLKRAAELLDKHYGNVAQIAYEVGFNNPSYFAECFRKQFGRLPSEHIAKGS